MSYVLEDPMIADYKPITIIKCDMHNVTCDMHDVHCTCVTYLTMNLIKSMPFSR